MLGLKFTTLAASGVLLAGLITGCSDDSGSDASTSSSGGGGAGASGAGGDGASGGIGGSGGTGGLGGGAAAQNRFLYVANRDGDSLSVFTIDEAGALAAVEEVAIDSPAPLAVDPQGQRLYAGSLQPKTVTAFAIDAASGSLSEIATTDVGARPVYLAVDHSGSSLLLASYGDNVANSYALEANGSVAQGPVSSHTTGTNPHSILLSNDNQFAFVPNTNSDSIAQFGFDANDGSLTPHNVQPDLPTTPGAGPRHMVFHPNGTWMYAVNEHADSVTRFELESKGTLAQQETVSTLPNGTAGDSNTCADLHITPDGKFLYASNRGHNSIAMFAVDAQSGALSSLGHQATEPIPREFEVTPDGRFVYVAGQQSGMLAAYSIEADGSLAELTKYTVGAAPLWVLAVAVDAPE